MPTVTTAAPADCRVLAKILREQDAAEVLAASGDQPLVALEKALHLSRATWAVRADDWGLIAMFGVGPHPANPEVGIPWLLASDRLESISRAFLRGCRPYISLMQSWYPTLTNVVDARNDVARRWLEWCGFSPCNWHDQFGVAQIPFIQYVRYRDV